MLLCAELLSRLELSLSREVSELSGIMLFDGVEVVMSPFSPQPVRQRRPNASVAARRIETIFFMFDMLLLPEFFREYARFDQTGSQSVFPFFKDLFRKERENEFF